MNTLQHKLQTGRVQLTELEYCKEPPNNGTGKKQVGILIKIIERDRERDANRRK